MKTKRLKKLKDLLTKAQIEKYQLNSELGIAGITDDSRKVCQNMLFVALAGACYDGADYIDVAIEKGACLIIAESKYKPTNHTRVTVIHMPSIRDHLMVMLSNFYEVDLTSLNFIGVTGTNGKTSVASMLAESISAGYVGTIGLGLIDDLRPSTNTTPSPFSLITFFQKLVDKKVDACVLEVSSHALCQKRVFGLPFQTAVFTNLTHEHLDYHGSMEAYAKAKYQLFLEYPIKNAVVCIDDDWGKALFSMLPKQVNALTYGLCAQADLYPLQLIESMEGIEVKLATPQGECQFLLPLIGRFNALNVMGMIATLIMQGWSLKDICHQVEKLSCIDGRMEVSHKSPYFVVDYAHTPDALEKALQALKPLCKGQLWCVFGCGGDRDRAKRPVMGKIAQVYADRCVITNDNPRSEPPQAIAEEIKQGMSVDNNTIDIILDRAAAIKYCFDNAGEGDVILVAGKGHEDHQILGTETVYFSDKACIKKLV